MRRIALLLCLLAGLACAACGSSAERGDTVDRRLSKIGAVPLNDKSTGALSDDPDCGETDIASDGYGTEIYPRNGPAGSVVAFSGTTLRGEDGKWAPSDRLEAWWNADAPANASGGTPSREGPVMRLVRVDDMERCSFETKFTVPDVEPGRYRITVFVWNAPPAEGYGIFIPHYFTVTEN